MNSVGNRSRRDDHRLPGGQKQQLRNADRRGNARM